MPFFTLAIASCLVVGDDPAFAGKWKTSFGEVALTADGDAITGSFGPFGRFKIAWKVEANTLKATYKEDAAEGTLSFALDPSGRSFQGRFQLKNGRAGVWNGWRTEPQGGRGSARRVRGVVAHRPRPHGADPGRREGRGQVRRARRINPSKGPRPADTSRSAGRRPAQAPDGSTSRRTDQRLLARPAQTVPAAGTAGPGGRPPSTPATPRSRRARRCRARPTAS